MAENGVLVRMLQDETYVQTKNYVYSKRVGMAWNENRYLLDGIPYLFAPFGSSKLTQQMREIVRSTAERSGRETLWGTVDHRTKDIIRVSLREIPPPPPHVSIWDLAVMELQGVNE